jgi:hypothetical protein
MMVCAVFSLTGCGDKLGAAPAFKDIQRPPPKAQPATADYLIANDRPLAEWIAETARKCNRFGCVGQV